MPYFRIVSAITLLALAPAAFAVPDADGKITSTPAPDLSGDLAMKARLSYNIGYETWQQTQELENAGAKLTGTRARENKEAVRSGYAMAREKFRIVVAADPNMKEGWNMLGYTSRRLGDYEESLSAYDKALALQPDYPEAIEYRAELFLLTGRLAQAKDAYAVLLKSSPSYAGTLKTSMKDFIKTGSSTPAVAPADRAAFAAWVATL
ncbi:MAG: tetratricopeptide repeat protein [Pseudomonadota bacterium]